MEVSPMADGRKLYSGTIRHPKHASELFLGIFRKSITGELEISAKPVEASRVESMVAEVYREMKASRSQKPAE